eukprot:3045746-Rhodomonas_salina.1
MPCLVLCYAIVCLVVFAASVTLLLCDETAPSLCDVRCDRRLPGKQAGGYETINGARQPVEDAGAEEEEGEGEDRGREGGREGGRGGCGEEQQEREGERGERERERGAARGAARAEGAHPYPGLP